MLSVELSVFGQKTEDELLREAKQKLLFIGTIQSVNCTIFNRPSHEVQLSKVLADVNIGLGVTLNQILPRVALLWCKNDRKDLLQIRTQQAYDTSATSANSLSADAFGFGLFHEDYFQSAHEVISDKNAQSRVYTDGITKATSIKTDFEHDSDLLSIQWFSSKSVRGSLDRWKLRLSYESVTSIVVDVVQNRLFLSLRYPPKLFCGLSPTNMKECFNWKRVLGFENCTNDVISTAPVLFLSLNEVGLDLFKLLSRLKLRTGLFPTFGCRQLQRLSERDYSLPTYRSLVFPNSFEATYLFQGFLKRGLPVTLPLTCDLEERNIFLTVITNGFIANPERFVKALTSLLNLVDQRRPVISWSQAFEFFNKTADMEEDVLDYKCVTIRKVVVTPSRLIILPAELLMSNRVLRKFGEEYALRICFREDDMGRMGYPQGQGKGQKDYGHELLENRVNEILLNGLTIGERHYYFLAYSNSQLRDHGCYGFCSYYTDNKLINVQMIREWMGDFKHFDSVSKLMAREGQCLTQTQSCLQLSEDDFEIVDDIRCVGFPSAPFSDGIGTMPYGKARDICKTHKPPLPIVPSAFQIRIAGIKGMLSVLAPGSRETKIKFRRSMRKFMSQELDLEIVKYSTPCGVYLNRPMIMILDQITQTKKDEYLDDNHKKVHTRMCNRIHSLVENDMFSLITMLYDEQKAAESLQIQAPTRMNYSHLRKAGFTFTNEPFFRSMLLAIYETALKQRLNKLKIEIPMHLGRTMFGILDESRVLNYGEVFVQYSTGIVGSNTIVLDGYVMVTKNPMVVLGDVRILKAVDKEELRHLVDVIVFPQQGPRPHTDEIAGSDLDGDEYSVFWDRQLMFDEDMNFEPMIRTNDTEPPRKSSITDKDRVDFFIKHMKSDSIGRISNAHLAQADRRGLTSKVCETLAQKHSKQVDFPKNGVLPVPLSRHENPSKYPDYMGKNFNRSYFSTRLVGQIHRRFEVLNDVYEVTQLELKLGIDPDLIVEFNSRDMRQEQARDVCTRYTNKVQALMDRYGITNEGSLISGHLTKIRNRISDKEKEDYSFLNTEKIIQNLYNNIYNSFRKEFFKEFGGESQWQKLGNASKVLNKAKAWYTVAYNDPGFMKSLPWVIWDVLCKAKTLQTQLRTNSDTSSISPVLVQSVDRACTNVPKPKQLFTMDAIERYCIDYPKLRPLLQMLRGWIRMESREHEMPESTQLFLLVIDFGIRSKYFVQSVDSPFDCTELLLDFFKYLASQDSKPISKVAEMANLRQAALMTLSRISLSLSVDCLYALNELNEELNWSFGEMPTMMIEVASSLNLQNTAHYMKNETGVTDACLRQRYTPRPKKSLLVSATGTTNKRRKLKHLLSTFYTHANEESSDDEGEVELFSPAFHESLVRMLNI